MSKPSKTVISRRTAVGFSIAAAEGSAQVSLYIGQNWDKLPANYKAAIEAARATVNSRMLAKYDHDNPMALKRPVAAGAQVRLYSKDILNTAFDAPEHIYPG
jgi:TRAP-type mannitol/chloroaromatic compound transport system substrate-binding protein